MQTINPYIAETNIYWNMLKNVRNEVKIRLITLLSQSITEVETSTDTSDDTKIFLSKFSGAWKGSDSAEEIISVINDGRNSKNPVSFD